MASKLVSVFHRQKRQIIGDSLSGREPTLETSEEPRMVLIRRVCSWCGREFAREYWRCRGEPPTTTWGICAQCIELREGEDDASRVEHGNAVAGRCGGLE